MRPALTLALALLTLAPLSSCTHKEHAAHRTASAEEIARLRKEKGLTKAPVKASGSGGSGEVGGRYVPMDTVENPGTIKGVVSYTGSLTDPVEVITKDKSTCEHHEHVNRPSHALLVKDGRLQNALVYLSDIRTGKKMVPGQVTVENRECRFEPRVQVAFQGGTVSALNSDAVLHNTHMFLKVGNRDLFNIALPRKGQEIKKKLKYRGLVDVKCDAHNWMQGWIYVAGNPYATVTDERGEFTLTDVPAGTYTAKVWHELLGEKEVKVTVTAGGTAELKVEM